jgi:hypothetical protein
MTLGILSHPVGSRLDTHAINRTTAFLARTLAPFFLEDIEIEKLAFCRRRNAICGQCNPAERERIVVKSHYQTSPPRPQGIECTGDDPA